MLKNVEGECWIKMLKNMTENVIYWSLICNNLRKMSNNVVKNVIKCV
jgi:hypothetical protein